MILRLPTALVLRTRDVPTLFVLVFCGLLGGSRADAAVTAEERISHYDISGTTASDLRREMNAKGPPSTGGKRHDGYTQWYVSWNYRYTISGGACTISSIATNLRTLITLPRWSNTSSAHADTRQRWARYLAALEQHEQGHRRFGVDAANEIDQAIARLPSNPNCDALDASVNAVANRILEKHVQRELDYDRDTAHGATQGARFP